MAYIPFKKSKRGRRPLRFKRSKPKKGVTLGVKKYVNRVVRKNMEHKCVQINGGFSFGNVNESPDFNAYPMCPLNTFWTISLGTGQGARIGNSITTRKVMLNYIIRQVGYDAVTNPIPQPSQVQLMLGYVRGTPSTVPVAADIQQLFQSGSGVTAPNGTLRDIVSVINKDYWVIRKRWGHRIGFSDNTGSGSNGPAAYYANNDFKLNAINRIDITKYIAKTIHFNDSGSSSLSKNLFLMCYAVAAIGGTYSSVQLPVNIEFWVDFHYTDA